MFTNTGNKSRISTESVSACTFDLFQFHVHQTETVVCCLSLFLQRYDWLVGSYNHTATKIPAKQIMNTNNDIRVKKINVSTPEKIHTFVLNYSKRKFFRFKGEVNRIHVCRSFGLRACSMSAIGVHFGYTSACVAIFKVSIAS